MATTPRARSTDDAPLGSADARTLDTPSQDVLPTDEDIRLEAALVERRNHTTNLADWSEAGNRLQQAGNLESPARAEAAPGEGGGVDDEDEVDEGELDEEEDEDDEQVEEDK
jgi:hypothetical protein